MLLSARILGNVGGVNSFTYETTARFTENDAPVVYFQLIDKALERSEQGYFPAGRRYMPAASSTLVVTFQNIDSAKTVTKNATQVYPTLDPSIWRVTILSTDDLVGTKDMALVLTETTGTTRGKLSQALTIESQTESMCS